MRILVLGGTAEGRALADLLVAQGHDVISSLAGRTRGPLLPAGQVRFGGFGGVAGLRRFLRDEGIQKVVNATHPFAAQMAAGAIAACQAAGVPLLRLERPGWSDRNDAGSWIWVVSHAAAAAAAAVVPGTVLLTVGRQHAHEYVEALAGRRVVCRVALAAGLDVPADWEIIESRGPFLLEEERQLLDETKTGVLVTKDAGGEHTAAKLDAARELGAQVVMIRRPDYQGVRVSSVAEALAWSNAPVSD